MLINRIGSALKSQRFEKKVQQILVILSIFLVVSFCFLQAWQRIYTSDFFPINGDFQNYNPVRRFLSGQTPFKDFSVYLGLGHLLLNAPFVYLGGNNFTSSLFVFTFTTNMIFSFIVFLTLYLALGKKLSALWITLLLVAVNISRPTIFTYLIPKELFVGLDAGLSPGISARMIRSGCVILVISLTLMYLRLLRSLLRGQGKIPFFIKENFNILSYFFAGSISSIAILWSNDVGVSSYLSYSFLFFILLISNKGFNFGKVLAGVSIYILSSAMTIMSTLWVITKGNVRSWVDFTLGVSSFQRWYYGLIEFDKIYYLDQIDHSTYVVFAFLLIIFLIYRICRLNFPRDSKLFESPLLRYWLLSYLLLTGLINITFTRLFSGGDSGELLYLVVFVIIISYILVLIKNEIVNNARLYQIMLNIFIFLCFSYALITASQSYVIVRKNFSSQRPGVFFNSLNGFLMNQNIVSDIETATYIIGNERIFSTYASAIEVETNQFQPTGADYIIHVLGEEQRKDYVNKFIEGKYPFVITMNPDPIGWEYWIRNANWFFYRELYKYYDQVYIGNYIIVWSKKTEINYAWKEYAVELTEITKSKYRLALTTKDKKYNGVVDVELNYRCDFKNKLNRPLIINKFVHITDTSLLDITNDIHSHYFIPTSSNSYHIPVSIVAGTGQIELDCYPNENTTLEINKVTTGYSFNNYFDSYKFANENQTVVSKLTDDNWENGVFRSGNVLLFVNSRRNFALLNGAKLLKSLTETAKVLAIDYDDYWIRVTIDGNKGVFANPNIIEVIN